jgi:ZIP family zinc transporter
MAFAIALHNLPEGMVIGASGAGAALGVTFSGAPLILAVVIGLHNLPEGMAVSTPLIAGGMGRIGAVLVTALSGAPTVLGALLGYHMGMAGPLSFSLSLSFASGAMLYVVFGELLPAATLMGRSKEPALARSGRPDHQPSYYPRIMRFAVRAGEIPASSALSPTDPKHEKRENTP